MFEWIQDDHEADSARVGTYNKKQYLKLSEMMSYMKIHQMF